MSKCRASLAHVRGRPASTLALPSCCLAAARRLAYKSVQGVGQRSAKFATSHDDAPCSAVGGYPRPARLLSPWLSTTTVASSPALQKWLDAVGACRAASAADVGVQGAWCPVPAVAGCCRPCTIPEMDDELSGTALTLQSLRTSTCHRLSLYSSASEYSSRSRAATGGGRIVDQIISAGPGSIPMTPPGSGIQLLPSIPGTALMIAAKTFVSDIFSVPTAR